MLRMESLPLGSLPALNPTAIQNALLDDEGGSPLSPLPSSFDPCSFLLDQDLPPTVSTMPASEQRYPCSSGQLQLLTPSGHSAAAALDAAPSCELLDLERAGLILPDPAELAVTPATSAPMSPRTRLGGSCPPSAAWAPFPTTPPALSVGLGRMGGGWAFPGSPTTPQALLAAAPAGLQLNSVVATPGTAAAAAGPPATQYACSAVHTPTQRGQRQAAGPAGVPQQVGCMGYLARVADAQPSFVPDLEEAAALAAGKPCVGSPAAGAFPQSLLQPPTGAADVPSPSHSNSQLSSQLAAAGVGVPRVASTANFGESPWPLPPLDSLPHLEGEEVGVWGASVTAAGAWAGEQAQQAMPLSKSASDTSDIAQLHLPHGTFLTPPHMRKGRGGRQPAPDPRLDPHVDPKRAKRILANRLSAAKSKLKQKKRTQDLKQQLGEACSHRDNLASELEAYMASCAAEEQRQQELSKQIKDLQGGR